MFALRQLHAYSRLLDDPLFARGPRPLLRAWPLRVWPREPAGGAGRLLRRPRPGLAPRVPALRALGSGSEVSSPRPCPSGACTWGPGQPGQRSAPCGLAPRVPALRVLGSGSEVSSPRPCPSGACAQGPGQQVRGQLPVALPLGCLRSGPWAAGQRSAPRGLAPQVPALRALGRRSEVSYQLPHWVKAWSQAPTQGRAGSATQGPSSSCA